MSFLVTEFGAMRSMVFSVSVGREHVTRGGGAEVRLLCNTTTQAYSPFKNGIKLGHDTRRATYLPKGVHTQ